MYGNALTPSAPKRDSCLKSEGGKCSSGGEGVKTILLQEEEGETAHREETLSRGKYIDFVQGEPERWEGHQEASSNPG